MSFDADALEDVGSDPFAAHCERCDDLATCGFADGTLLCDDCHAEALARGETE